MFKKAKEQEERIKALEEKIKEFEDRLYITNGTIQKLWDETHPKTMGGI